MLVLTRKNQESVVVGDSDRFERLLKVTVLEINSQSVRLGFEVNSDVPIVRARVRKKGQRGANAGHSAAKPVDPLEE
jgi:carbon storage regulator CsrA